MEVDFDTHLNSIWHKRSKMIFIDWTSFQVADEQPSFHPSNLWPSVYMASNAKKKCKLIKKTFGKRKFCTVFDFREHPVVSKRKQDSCHSWSTCKVIYKVFCSHVISIFFYLSPNRMWNFVTKIFRYWSFPIVTGHGTENVLLVKFEILGLG